jgi:chromosome segregation ATPase
MTDGTAAATAVLPARAQREPFSAPVTPVDERRFESEIRRIDTTISEERKNREKFETRIEKAVGDLRVEMNARFEKMEKSVDARFDRMEKSVDARFDRMEKSIDARFQSVDARFQSIDSRFQSIDAQFKSVDARLEKLNDKMDGNFKATVTIYLTTMGVLLAAFYAFASYMTR